jgi:hypothetical protein
MKRMALLLLALACARVDAMEVRGRVLDPDDAPVAGADVWLSRERLVTTTKTDDAGQFAFLDTRPGMFSLTARTPEYALTGLSGYIFDDLEVDLHMDVPDTVRIRVIDHAGKAVEGVRVKRILISNVFEVFPDELVPYGFPSIRSDADGAIAILGIPRGSFVSVTLEHRKYCDLVLPYLVPHPTQHPAQLYPGEVLRGQITTADAAPLPSASVRIFRKTEDERELLYDALADSEGYYRIIIPPGDYSLEVHHPDHPTAAPFDVQIRDGAGETNADIALPPPHTVEGAVVGPKGNPFPGVAINYLVKDYVQDEAFTDKEGRFSLTVGPGEGRVHVLPPPGFMTADPHDVVVHITKASLSEVGSIALKRLPALRGTVFTAGGTPEKNVLIRTLSLKTPLFALTDENGTFDIPLEILPKEERVQLRAEHATQFLRCDFEIDVRKPEEDVEVRLRPFEPELAANEPGKAPNDLSKLVNQTAPPLACSAWLDEKPVTLAELRGKVVVLLFWAGFDPYGRNETTLSEVLLLHRALAGSADDVAFIGVHDDSDPLEVVREYVAELGLGFPVGIDTAPMVTHQSYAVRVLPQVILIDKQGLLRYFDVEGRLSELVKDLRRRP